MNGSNITDDSQTSISTALAEIERKTKHYPQEEDASIADSNQRLDRYRLKARRARSRRTST